MGVSSRPRVQDRRRLGHAAGAAERAGSACASPRRRPPVKRAGERAEALAAVRWGFRAAFRRRRTSDRRPSDTAPPRVHAHRLFLSTLAMLEAAEEAKPMVGGDCFVLCGGRAVQFFSFLLLSSV